MSEIMVSEENGNFRDYCFGDLHLLSPLCFDRIQSDIFLYLYKKGGACRVGSILTLGGTTPVTFATALPLQFAETLFGKPELSVTNLAIGHIARKYGASYLCNSYLCDAKLPSSEAGMQKTISAVSAILAGSKSFGCAGLLIIVK